MNYMLALAMVKASVPKAKRKRRVKVVCSVRRDPACRVDYCGYDWRLPIASS